MTHEERAALKHLIDQKRRHQLADRGTSRTERRLSAALRIIERLRRRADHHEKRAQTWSDRYHRAKAERDALWAELDARRATSTEPYLTEGAAKAARARTFRHSSARRNEQRRTAA